MAAPQRLPAAVQIQPATASAEQLLALHAAWPQRYPGFLESAACGPSGTGYDILFAHPQASLALQGNGVLHGAVPPGTATFLDALDAWWRNEPGAPPLDTGLGLSRVSQGQPSLPFTSGWLLYLGYELAGQIEPSLKLHAPKALPIAWAVRVPAAIVRERPSGRCWLVAETAHSELLASMAADLQSVPALAEPASALVQGEIQEEPPADFIRCVERALEFIAAGDVYQANLSRGWQAELAPGVTPVQLYQRLRQTNPGPFSGLLQLPGGSIVSSSPERLVDVRGGWASTRPIAGTHPRGQTEQQDRQLAHDLKAHPKERAEHVMLIDLERNDLGRLSEAGTVEVDEYMTIESYAHVHHIVSNVRGKLRRDVTPAQVLAAVFPGGTITGCPKVRCMQIISQLEQQARSAYTGSFGYLNLDGSMDMNILIRTLEVQGGQLTLRAGAGIVADSQPQRELQETRAKARGVLRALGSDQ